MVFRYISGLILAMVIAAIVIIIFAGPKKDYVTDEGSVNCQWDKVNEALEQASPEKYGLYGEPDYLEREQVSNAVWYTNIPPEDDEWNTKDRVYLRVSYGATLYELESLGGDVYKFFRDPMIEIYLVKYPEGDFRYSVTYGLDGKLAVERGEWFLEENKEEYCRYYFETMLEMIGKKK